MLHSLVRSLARWLLGPAARAGRQVLDRDARLALAPRTLEDVGVAQAPVDPSTLATASAAGFPRRVGHLLVYDGGRKDTRSGGDGPLGRPTPVGAAARTASRRS